jgi:hypothetical protein
MIQTAMPTSVRSLRQVCRTLAKPLAFRQIIHRRRDETNKTGTVFSIVVA